MSGSPKGGPLLSTIRRNGMTAAEAERFLAATWYVLEEQGLATPLLTPRQAGALLDISLSFSSAQECALMENRLSQILQNTRA
jgi:hypothetical protein